MKLSMDGKAILFKQIATKSVWFAAKERDELAHWLSPLDFGPNLAEHYDRWTKGTGTWFLDSKEVVDWISGKFQRLWCQGNRKCHQQ